MVKTTQKEIIYWSCLGPIKKQLGVVKGLVFTWLISRPYQAPRNVQMAPWLLSMGTCLQTQSAPESAERAS